MKIQAEKESISDLNGWICLNKPAGISSNLSMIKVRKILQRNTGYVGTLDPFAIGVLPIAVGEARKFIKYIENTDKKYIFTMFFGATTDTLDKDGKITETTSKIPSKNDIQEILGEFCGEIEQIPPIFSAIKINGKRSCDRVRNGEKPQLSSRNVIVYSLKIVEENLKNNEVKFEISCSKGTYVRSIARDIAERLGSLGYVKSLCRTKSGFFSIKNSISLEKLIEIGDTHEMASVLVPLESPLDDIPALYLRNDEIVTLQHGLRIAVEKHMIMLFEVRIFSVENRGFYGIGFISDDGSLRAMRMCIPK